MKLKSTLLFLLCICFMPAIFSQSKAHSKHIHAAPDLTGKRSDTINVLHYTINLNITDFKTDTLRGNTVIQFTPKMNNINSLSLDLLKFKIDSVIMNKSQPGYSYNDTLLIIQLPSTENTGDTSSVTIYYHGKPQIDASGWGGFYFAGGYAFNLGVGFTVIPHNYGRAWYPCFDNFIERATYDFNITCSKTNTVFCNGYLAHDTIDTITSLRTRSWHMPDPIPSYEASVDVAPYTQLNDIYYGADTIPILIAGLPADTANIRKSFVHLKNAISIYQTAYGKYPWNKVGYSMVDFNGGAMEHPTNIAFPAVCADGTINYEVNIMAHELSHHWCGDMVTCSTAEDMWLNEGYATFNQYLFTEKMYGEAQYHAAVRTSHESVLHYCHIADRGYWPISGVPQAYTYGNLNFWESTTYKKGGDVIYTLRNYMGDSVFFKGMQYYFGSHRFEPVNADTLKTSLEKSSGMNLTDFFTQWVYAPGFPHFSIDSMTATPSGLNYSVKIYVKQKLTGAPAYYNNVPLQVNFKSATWQNNYQSINVSGHLSSYSFTVPFKPVFAGLNLDEKVSEAIAPDTIIIKKTGLTTLVNSRIQIVTGSVTDSAFIYVEHNYTAPDAVKDTSLHYRLSPNRYWKISGILPSGFTAKATLDFDGRKLNNTAGSYYLDTALTVKTRDSLILLYRKNAGQDWKEFPAYTKKDVGPSANMYGTFNLDSLPMGEYTFANGVSHVIGIDEQKDISKTLRVYPNPSSNGFTVDFAASATEQYLLVYDEQGKLMAQVNTSSSQKSMDINTAKWENGVYIISLYNNTGKEMASTRIVVAH